MLYRCICPILQLFLLLSLPLVLQTSPTAASTACDALADVGKSGCYMPDAAGAVIDAARTICILNDPTVSGVQGADQVCADVCDVSRISTQYAIAAAGTDNFEQINNAFTQLIVGVRAGNNHNVECTGAPAWWKAMNHDWCKPGKPCDHTFNQAKLDDCTVDSDRTVCRGMCVVDPSGPGGRGCWDMCDRHHEAILYQEGAREGVEAEVLAARTDGTCSATNWVPWALLTLFFVLVGICIVAGIYIKMQKGKPRGFRQDQPAYDQPAYDQSAYDPQPAFDMGTQGMPLTDPMPPPVPPQRPASNQGSFPPLNSQQFFGEPNLRVPSIAPPPQSFSQVPQNHQQTIHEYGVSMNPMHAQTYSQPAYPQPTSSQNYAGYASPMPGYQNGRAPSLGQQQPPSPFGTQQGGFQFYKQ